VNETTATVSTVEGEKEGFCHRFSLGTRTNTLIIVWVTVPITANKHALNHAYSKTRTKPYI
jgi:hypothetical protein